ncbi:MAG: methyltransferase domain-containing protein [Candidatus Cloacimonetes bacterium]|nr:methyltransferase domain-containing protein [Candidatus Cloacimonadota bacterium]
MKNFIKKVIYLILRLSRFIESIFDQDYLCHDVQPPKYVAHQDWEKYLLTLSNKEGFRVLEIGSRAVTGCSLAKQSFTRAEYIGFDCIEGKNVDIVGDAHRLSQYFSEDEKFDLIYSSASFEHFSMPWLVASEMVKLLKVGGFVFVETHFSHSSHERPSNYFQFSDLGLKVLFSQELGIECIDSGMSNSIIGRFSTFADEYLRYESVPGLYCHSEFLGRKTHDVEGFSWNNPPEAKPNYPKK